MKINVIIIANIREFNTVNLLSEKCILGKSYLYIEYDDHKNIGGVGKLLML